MVGGTSGVMKKALLIGGGVLLGIWMLGMLVLIVFRPVTVVPRLGLAPGYALVDQTGGRLTSEDLRGAIAVYTLGYSSCRTRCFPTDSILGEVQARLGEAELGDVPVRLVSLSIDPARDTPPVLDSLARAREADPSVWTFATGEPSALKTLIGTGFELYYAEQDDGQIAYDPAFLIVDGNGLLRRKYRVGLPTADRLLNDLRLIAKEARAATGASRLAYEAAHLFACYSN